MKFKNLFIVALLLLLIPSVWSLLLSGFFETDDGEWMVIRFSAFYQALSDGQFPVRFLGRLNFGYGYPVANFLYPGFMYLAVPLQILGLGFVNSIKIIMFASMLGGGVFTFAWLSKIFDKRSALIGSIFFTYTPYHLFDLYKRGSIGEILSLTWVAFVLWAIEEKNKFLISIGIFFLAISHNSLFLLFVPLLFVYVFIRKKLSIQDLIISFGLGILMSSFFTIPAIFDLSYTDFSKIEISNIREYFASIDLIGVSSIAVFVSSLLILYLKKFKESREVYFFIIVSFISILLSISLSEFVWSFLPTQLIQFPFRLLSYLVISGAFLTSYLLFNIKSNKKVISIIIIAVIFLSSLNFLFPKVRFDKEEGFYSTNEATTTVKDEYMPVWVKEKPTKHFDQKVEVIKGRGEISNLAYNAKIITFNFKSEADSRVRINTIYYPGWRARVNGENVKINYSNPKGVMEIILPKGENKIELEFLETQLRIFSDLLSILGFILLFGVSGYSLFKKKK